MKVELSDQQINSIISVLMSVSVPVKDAPQIQALAKAVSTPVKEDKPKDA